MFEKFNEQARSAMKEARAFALEMGHHYVGTAHMLVGLIKHADERLSSAIALCDFSNDELIGALMKNLRKLAKEETAEKRAAHEDKISGDVSGATSETTSEISSETASEPASELASEPASELASESSSSDAAFADASDVIYEAASDTTSHTSSEASSDVAPAGHIPYTPNAKKAIMQSFRCFLSIGEVQVSPAHMVLGIIQAAPNQAVRCLQEAGISPQALSSFIKNSLTQDHAGHDGASFMSPAGIPGGDESVVAALGSLGAALGAALMGENDPLDLQKSFGEVRALTPEEANKFAEMLGKESLDSRMGIMDGMDFSEDDDAADMVQNSQREQGQSSKKASFLKHFARNLTERAAEGKLDPVIGREAEIERVIQILARRQKNNPLILGDPGVGKTAVVEGLAQAIYEGEVPSMLLGKQIWMLDISALVAGTRFRGDFEMRMKRLIQEVSQNKRIILFIDELHMVLGAGAAESSTDAASILKPALSRGEIQIIGATTADEYRKHIEKDSAFERRFQTVQVEEPSIEDSLTILEGLQERYEKHHNVHYLPEALEAAVKLSHRYIQDRHLPDKAIDALDEAGARARVRASGLPDFFKELSTELEELREKKAEAARRQEFELAADLRDREHELIKQRDEQMKAWQDHDKAHPGEIDVEAIAEVIADITGVPVTSITEDEASKLLRSEDVLHERIIGQDEAVKKVARAIRRSRSPLKDPRRPGGSFIFLGPSGVGKTELAKSLAEFLFGDESALIAFDMSEFMEKHAVSKLVGAPPGYVGYEEGGELTKAVRRRPYSVVLFDEIEKADPDVFNVLLQILEEGHLTDGQGRVVDFSNTVIIMTSNIGARDIAHTSTMGFSAAGDAGLSDKEIDSRVRNELKRQFRPEFLNRVDEIVVFKSLTKEELRGIVELMIADLRDRLVAQGMSIELTEAARDFVAERGVDPIYGARPLRRAIQTLIEDPLSEELLSGNWKAGDIVKVDVASGLASDPASELGADSRTQFKSDPASSSLLGNSAEKLDDPLAEEEKLVFSKITGKIPAPRCRETMRKASSRRESGRASRPHYAQGGHRSASS